MNTFSTSNEKYWLFASYQSGISAAPFVITEHNDTYIVQMLRDMSFSFTADVSTNSETTETDEFKRFDFAICAISTAICPKYSDIVTEIKRSWSRVKILPLFNLALRSDCLTETVMEHHTDHEAILSTGIHIAKCEMVDKRHVFTDETEIENTHFVVSNPQIVYKKKYLDDLLS